MANSTNITNPSALLERVARAIYESRPRHPRAEWQHEPPAVRDGVRASARAAIEAMREPTEAMMDNGAALCEGDTAVDASDSCRAIYDAMIDAALTKPEERGNG